MGTNKGTLVALNAILRDPHRHVDGNASFLVLGCRRGEDAVGRYGAHREFVALLGQHGPHDLGHELGFVFFKVGFLTGRGPVIRDLDFLQGAHSSVHGSLVHLNDLFALLAVSLLNGLFDVPEGLFRRNDIGDLEEGRLHDHVDAAAQTQVRGDLHGIDVVELDFFLCEGSLHGVGQLLLHLLRAPR